MVLGNWPAEREAIDGVRDYTPNPTQNLLVRQARVSSSLSIKVALLSGGERVEAIALPCPEAGTVKFIRSRARDLVHV